MLPTSFALAYAFLGGLAGGFTARILRDPAAPVAVGVIACGLTALILRLSFL